MSGEIIYVFNKNIATNVDGYRELCNFYYKYKSIKNEIVYLEFSKINTFDANLSALFAAMLYKLKKENALKFVTDKRVVKQKFESLFKNGFLTGKSQSLNHDSNELRIIAFNPEKGDQSFLKYIKEDLLLHSKMNISQEKKYTLTEHFLEVFANVQIHARTEDYTFACGQYMPNQKRLCFTFLDLGEGFLTPIQHYTKGSISNCRDAVEWALKKGNSTKGDAPGGLGLSGIASFCQETNSSLHIITGNTYCTLENNKQKFKEIQPFCGSIIHIIFNYEK